MEGRFILSDKKDNYTDYFFTLARDKDTRLLAGVVFMVSGMGAVDV